MLKIISIEESENDFSLNVIFNDGACGEINFTDLIEKHTAFSILKDKDNFNAFCLNHGAIEWNSNLDISNNWIYENMAITREPTKDIDISFLIHILEVDKKTFADAMCITLEKLDAWIDSSLEPEQLELKVLKGLMNRPAFISELIN